MPILEQIAEIGMFSVGPDRSFSREFDIFNENSAAEAFAHAINTGQLGIRQAYGCFWTRENCYDSSDKYLKGTYERIVPLIALHLDAKGLQEMVEILSEVYFERRGSLFEYDELPYWTRRLSGPRGIVNDLCTAGKIIGYNSDKVDCESGICNKIIKELVKILSNYRFTENIYYPEDAEKVAEALSQIRTIAAFGELVKAAQERTDRIEYCGENSVARSIFYQRVKEILDDMSKGLDNEDMDKKVKESLNPREICPDIVNRFGGRMTFYYLLENAERFVPYKGERNKENMNMSYYMSLLCTLCNEGFSERAVMAFNSQVTGIVDKELMEGYMGAIEDFSIGAVGMHKPIRYQSKERVHEELREKGVWIVGLKEIR